MDLKFTPIYNANGAFLYQDISFTLGKLDVVDGIDEIKNRLICNVMTYRGELFTDPTFGTDYFNNVFGKEVTDTELIDEMKASILNTRGVTEIKSFNISRPDGSRDATLTAQVLTTQGEIDLVTPIQT